MKDPVLFQGEIITKLRKYIEEIKKKSSRTIEPLSTKLGTKHPRMKVIQVCSNEGPRPFQMEIITKKRKYIDEIKKFSSPEARGQT